MCIRDRFCPILQFSPITHKGMMWVKCQIRVPSPMVQPSSITAVGCAEKDIRAIDPTMEDGRIANVLKAGLKRTITALLQHSQRCHASYDSLLSWLFVEYSCLMQGICDPVERIHIHCPIQVPFQRTVPFRGIIGCHPIT